jgi:D-alanine-D-alanine ligase
VVGEVVPCNEFYDYDAKYLANESELHIPARLSEDMLRKVQAQAIKSYRALGCEGFTRVDFFVKDNGEIFLNEPNTIPGFTSISMYPKLWAATGLPYAELLDKLLTLAMER